MGSFALFVALPEELEAAAAVLQDMATLITPLARLGQGQTQFHCAIEDRKGQMHSGDVFLISGMGNIKSAAFVGASFASGVQPQHAVLVGISGALSDTVGLTDVVLSSHVKYYAPDKIRSLDTDYVLINEQDRTRLCDPTNDLSAAKLLAGKQGIDDRDVTSSESFYRYMRDVKFDKAGANTIDLYLHNRRAAIESILQERSGKSVNVTEGALLGSNMVIDSGGYVSYLKDKNIFDCTDFYVMNAPEEYMGRCKWNKSELIAVDMESYGFFSALESFLPIGSAVRGVAVRGISDLAAGKTESDRSTRGEIRRTAAAHAMVVAIDYLQEQLTPQTFRS